MRKIDREPRGRARFAPGQELVVAGTVGKAGAGLVLEQKRECLEARFSTCFLQRLEAAAGRTLGLTSARLTACGATEWEPVGEGGILAALWDISGGYGCGFWADLLKVPADQEIIEVCELFDLNPYRLRSGECILIAADRGLFTVRALEELAVRAAVIGVIEEGIARRVSISGVTGFLERPKPDEIYKITGNALLE